MNLISISQLRKNGRLLATAMASMAIILGLVAVTLASLLNLEACHLCIFQRFAYFVIGLLTFLAVISWHRPFFRLASLISTAAFSVWGLFVAAQQSWIQWFPESGLSCHMDEIGITERVVDWLGERYPLFFMATGFCESKDLVIAGLSLANWSFLILLGFLVATMTLIALHFRKITELQGS